MKYKWYIMYTKKGAESRVCHLLAKKMIQSYYPVLKSLSKRAVWKEITYEPLFQSYVFVYTTEKQVSTLKQIGGVISVVYWLNKPATLKDSEINIIKAFLSRFSNVWLEKEAFVNLKGHVEVRRIQVPKDNVVNTNKTWLKATLPSLGYSLLSEIDKTDFAIHSEINLILSHTKVIIRNRAVRAQVHHDSSIV